MDVQKADAGRNLSNRSFFLNKLCLLLLLAVAFCLFFPVKAKAEIIRKQSDTDRRR